MATGYLPALEYLRPVTQTSYDRAHEVCILLTVHVYAREVFIIGIA